FLRNSICVKGAEPSVLFRTTAALESVMIGVDERFSGAPGPSVSLTPVCGNEYIHVARLRFLHVARFAPPPPGRSRDHSRSGLAAGDDGTLCHLARAHGGRLSPSRGGMRSARAAGRLS